MIKFRVFDKRYNTYLSPVKVGNMLWDALNSKDYILELCTGLQDKNGKEIYVGDILKFTDAREWGGNNLPIRLCESILSLEDTFGVSDLKYYWEVIGNINENKEMLE